MYVKRWRLSIARELTFDLAWNVGTCMYMLWTALPLIIGFVNSIIWDGNALDSARWWCEITTRVRFDPPISVSRRLTISLDFRWR